MADEDKKLDTEEIEKEEVVETASETLKLDDQRLPFVGGFVGAIIFLIAVTSESGIDKDNESKYWGYGIALSVVAMFFTLIALGLTHKPGLIEGKPQVLDSLNHFLFLWNFVGACIMTFGGGPFPLTSNGYFAVWGMAIFATMGLGVSSNTVKNAGSMMGHLAASIIVIIALASHENAFDDYKGESIFGIVMACLSATVVVYQVSMQRIGSEGLGSTIMFPVLAVFAISWVVAASLMTFRGPFILTGNGYFGAWGGAFTGVFAAMAAKQNA